VKLGRDYSLIEFERVTKMFPHVYRNSPAFQRIGERFVGIANVAVAESPSEIASGQAKLPCSIN